jgi:hypothetical protein
LPQRAGNYGNEGVNIEFTSFNKSAYNYFGINRTIKESYLDYKYEINNPSILINDGQLYYKSNNSDNISNGGNILYGKYVEKIYPSNTYFNTIQYEKDADPVRSGLRYSQAIDSEDQGSTPEE